MKKGILFLIIAMSLVFLPGIALSVKRDEVRVALVSDVGILNLLEFKTLDAIQVLSSVQQGLLGSRVDENGIRDLLLAESVEVLRNKKDVRVKLKKGIKFHNGDPFTALDVAFTVAQVQDPENANILSSSYDEIEEVEIVDEHTLVFHFYDPFAPWQEVMWLGNSSKKYYEKVGKTKFRKNPVGTGPMRLLEHRIGESVTLEGVEGHPDYNGDYNRIKCFIVNDPMTRVAMLETGAIDLAAGVSSYLVNRLKKHDYIRIKRSAPPNLFFLSVKASLFPVIEDTKVRLAMNHAINRREIIDRAFLGEGYPVYTWAKGELGYDPNLKYEFDPGKARKLLAESGYKPGTPITLVHHPFIVTGTNEAMVSQMVQHYLRNVGMTVKLQRMETGVYLTYSRNKDKRVGHMGLSSWPIQTDPQLRLLISMMSNGDYCNYTSRPNKTEMDALIQAQARETNPRKRLAILKKIQRIDYADPANITLYGLNAIYAMNKKIEYTWSPNATIIQDLHTMRIVE